MLMFFRRSSPRGPSLLNAETVIAENSFLKTRVGDLVAELAGVRKELNVGSMFLRIAVHSCLFVGALRLCSPLQQHISFAFV